MKSQYSTSFFIDINRLGCLPEPNKCEKVIFIMNDKQPSNPLHGITLEQILNELVKHFGWKTLGEMIRIRCFNNDPSIKSSLNFLRRTKWARIKVEKLFLEISKDKK
jgi:uncharacterized protein (DUF2132 family)